MIDNNEIKIESLAHHGLVAAIGKILKIGDKIDSRLPVQDRTVNLTRGQSAMAMIINGLGFIERRLYMVENFFSDKPVKKLLGDNVSSEQLNDDNLGRTLDAIHEYGVTKLFSEIAFEVALEHNAIGRYGHLDTTSMSVEGDYETGSEDDEVPFKITYGHSKDHRPDLKQLVLSLTTTGPAAFPLWLEALSGNSADKTNFSNTIETVKKFQKELKQMEPLTWVADSALYNKEKLLSKFNDVAWVTRVPETISEARKLVQMNEKDLEWKKLSDGYSISPCESNYGGVKQRWFLVYSENAFKNEEESSKSFIEKKEESLKKLLKKLENQIFFCEKDARKEANKIIKKHSLFIISYSCVPVFGGVVGKKGRPSEEERIIKGYKLEVQYTFNQIEVTKIENARGRFILATNDFNLEKLPDENVLTEYKNQSKTEKGFKFLKDPSFFASEIYLKKPERVEALMFIMGMCLMIYNVGQYHLRKILENEKETVPNQSGKKIKNPTLKWIFQCFRSISILKIFDENGNIIREIVSNLTNLHRRIISYFGQVAMEIYGTHDPLIKNRKMEYPLLLT